MAAFNWINVEAPCPVCNNVSRLRCQTHIASDYTGDRSGRFHDREYALGQPMAWWPHGHKRFREWRANRQRSGKVESEFDDEACSATCGICNAELFVVVRFRENVPERVLTIGKEEAWPDEYLR